MKSIIIVGSGVAGTTLARQLLTNTDCEITIYEAGEDFTMADRRLWLDRLQAGKNIYGQYLDDPHDDIEYFGLRGSRLFMKGGTTSHWAGNTPRFKPEDFELQSRTGYGADWPFGYETLAPYYTKAEHLLGVTGDSDNDDPPRFGDRFPFPHTDYTLGDRIMIEAFEQHDISYGHMSVTRDGNRCITTGTCHYCPVGARYSACFDLTLLENQFPERLTVKTESPVTAIEMDGKKRARGVRYLDLRGGESHSDEADLVIVSSGTIESCKLLLASANREWKDGIGNDSDHVGRHLIGHPLMFADGVKPGNPDKLGQELGFGSLISRHFDSPAMQDKGKMWFSAGAGLTESLEDRILSNSSRADIERGVSSELRLSLSGEMEQFETPVNHVSLGKGTTRHGLPTTHIEVDVHKINLQTRQNYVETFSRILETAGCTPDSIETGSLDPDGAHASATCRMSQSDSDGVVDPNLQVHGTDNLFVCSNAVFPSIAAANPTLTLTALAVRLAEHLGNT